MATTLRVQDLVRSSRQEYTQGTLEEGQLHADPYRQLAGWLEEAEETGVREANAMTLATADAAGEPSARVVLLRGLDARGLTFYTNYRSRKGRDLEVNPRASAVFFWAELERQVRVSGAVEKVSRGESEGYFYSRPRRSRIAAMASPQSEVIYSRRVLEDQFRELELLYGNREIPLPEHWGGYRLVADRFEFWQGRRSRMHDRLEYVRQGAAWEVQRLAP